MVYKKYKKIINRLKKQIVYLNDIIEQLPGGVYWKNKKGVYLGHNTKAVEKIVHLRGKHTEVITSLVGKTDEDVLATEWRENYLTQDWQVIATERPLLTEEVVKLANGKTLMELSIKKPFYNKRGKLIGIIGVIIDINYLTLLENLQKNEEAKNIRLKMVKKMKWEIRQPFNTIWKVTNHLRDKEESPVKREHLSTINQHTEQILDYFNNIFDYYRIKCDLLEIILKDFSLKELVDKVVKNLLASLFSKNLTLKKSYDLNIPLLLQGDSYRLQRILINLLSHVINLTKEHGKIELKILLMETSTDDKAEIEFTIKSCVSNTIKTCEKLDPIHQENQVINEELRIAKQFVEDMQGTIQWENNKYVGFICTIPFNVV